MSSGWLGRIESASAAKVLYSLVWVSRGGPFISRHLIRAFSISISPPDTPTIAGEGKSVSHALASRRCARSGPFSFSMPQRGGVSSGAGGRMDRLLRRPDEEEGLA